MAWGSVVLSCLVMDVAMGVVDLRKFRYVIWECVTSVSEKVSMYANISSPGD
jgi:hypothetical protein